MLRELGIKVWFVNVVDLLKIQNVCENDQPSAMSAGLSCLAAARSPCSLHFTPMPARSAV